VLKGWVNDENIHSDSRNIGIFFYQQLFASPQWYEVISCPVIATLDAGNLETLTQSGFVIKSGSLKPVQEKNLYGCFRCTRCRAIEAN